MQGAEAADGLVGDSFYRLDRCRILWWRCLFEKPRSEDADARHLVGDQIDLTVQTEKYFGTLPGSYRDGSCRVLRPVAGRLVVGVA